MTSERTGSPRTWTIAEAKARLSEILRLAEEEGPQRIGVRNSYVVVPERTWQEHEPEPEPERLPMGKWIVQNWPRGIELELPSRVDPERAILFADFDEDDWGDE